MPKRFCVTGTCIPEKNYMVDISERLERIVKDYIEQGNYFTIVHGSTGRRQRFIYWSAVCRKTIWC